MNKCLKIFSAVWFSSIITIVLYLYIFIGSAGIMSLMYHATTQYFMIMSGPKKPYSVEFSAVRDVMGMMEDELDKNGMDLPENPLDMRSQVDTYIGMATKGSSFGSNAMCPRIPSGIIEIFDVDVPVPEEDAETEGEMKNLKFHSIVWPGLEDTTRTILYYHGGGFLSGNVENIYPFLSRLSRLTRSKVLGLEYKLAPENKLPYQYDDCLFAYEWLLTKSKGSEISLGGESAGGGLVTGVIQRAVEKGVEMPSSIFLISPWVDLSLSFSKYTEEFEYMIKYSVSEEYDTKDPLISPLWGDFKGFPPAFVSVAKSEEIEFEVDELVKRMEKEEENSEIEYLKTDIDSVHAWILMCTTEGVEDTAVLAYWLRKHF